MARHPARHPRPRSALRRLPVAPFHTIADAAREHDVNQAVLERDLNGDGGKKPEAGLGCRTAFRKQEQSVRRDHRHFLASAPDQSLIFPGGEKAAHHRGSVVPVISAIS